MKKFFIGLAVIMISIISVAVWSFYRSGFNGEKHASASAVIGSTQQINLPSGAGVKGSSTNPFIILEIVPYEGFAEIGYSIGGSEPVPMDQVKFDGNYNLKESTKLMGIQQIFEYSMDLTDVPPNPDKTFGKWYELGNNTYYGYFKKVDTGTGDFSVKLSGSTVISYEKKVGDYVWVFAENIWNQNSPPANKEEGKTYYKASRVGNAYCRYSNIYTNYEYFKKNVLELSDPTQIANYHTMVITITPKNLNLPCNFGLIDRADLISISPKEHDTTLVNLWDKYHTSLVKSRPTDGFKNNDLTWETTAEILRKASVDDHIAPIIFDVTVFTNDYSYSGGDITPIKKYSTGEVVSGLNAKGYMNNIAKLYMIMQLMSPTKFYNEYIMTGMIKSVPIKNNGTNVKNGTVNLTAGYYIDQDSNYNRYTSYQLNDANSAAIWNRYTFLPYNHYKNPNGAFDHSVWKAEGIDYNFMEGDYSNVSVRHNMYSYNGDCSLTQDFVKSDKIGYNSYRKEAFDYYNMTSGSISPSLAIKFLVASNINKPVYSKTTLRILEIEPCNDFIWDGSTNANQFYRKFFPNFTGDITVTKMTSSEFIGDLDDLNTTYDLIFFGMEDDIMKQDSNGVTLYNDPNMKGRIYSHNGDLVKIDDDDSNNNNQGKNESDKDDANDRFLGLPGTKNPPDTYRYSGNDITNRKLDELKEFMSAGNPVILDNGFYNSSSRSSINTTKIDPNSNVYSLANLNTTTYPQLFYADGIVTRQLEEQLTRVNCKIIFGDTDKKLDPDKSYPVVYKDKTKTGNSGLTDSQIYINGNNSSFRALHYNFYIKDNDDANASYTVKLYIDINADGRFDEVKENVSNLTIMTADGDSEDYDSLKPGVNYTLSRNLESSFSGIIPWKLEIYSNQYPNKEVRDSVINYCALKSNAATKTHLNILHIKSTPTDSLNFRNAIIKKYVDLLDGYDISVKEVSVSTIVNDLGIKKSGPYVYLLSDDDDDDNLNGGPDGFDDDNDGIFDFDMVVLGIADTYTDISENYVLRNITDFIERGKTVLFTHDTTSYVNSLDAYNFNTTTIYSRGYYINKWFRESLGMDRFGATFATAQERINAGKDYASNRSDFSGYIQGYSNGSLDRYADDEIGQYGSHVNVKIPMDWQISDKVTKTNDGQLTKYPYEIPDSFTPAGTHSQYYQLDMENPNIVVWFCLSDSAANKYYSTTPNDVRNNYYIYNLGNVTYSGMGHKADITDIEAKLFVNTLIAAYNASAKPIQIELTNKNVSKNSYGTNYVYVDYDIYDTTNAYGNEVQKDSSSQYQRIKFRVIDNNLLLNKTITLSYYAVKTVNGVEVETKITGLTAKRVKNNSTVSTNSNGDIVNSGTEYYIDIPLSQIQDNKMLVSNNFATKISIHSLLTYGIGVDRTLSSKLDFILVRRGLFDLE